MTPEPNHIPPPSLRQRFKTLRKNMNWSWKDIDRITGRKNTLSNISKGVPNWARLAIVTNERYQHLLRLHVIDAVRRELGYEWTLRRRSPEAFSFTPPHPVGHHLTLFFGYGQFRLVSNSPRMTEVSELFNDLYAAPESQKHPDGSTELIFPLVATVAAERQLNAYLEEHGLPE